MSAEIISSGSSLGKKEVTNQDLFDKISNFDKESALKSLLKKKVVVDSAQDKEVFSEWVKKVSGIESRPFIEIESEKKLEVEELARVASEQAILKAGIEKEEIDQVIFSTYSSNRVMPSPACTLINFLNLKEASAITINGACSGFLDALIDAVIKIESGYFKTILVVAAEHLSNKMDYNDPKSSIIFSDGGGAVIVRKIEDSNKRVLGFASGTAFSEQVYMERKEHIYFNSGPLVERNAVKVMLSICEEVLSDKYRFDEIDYIIPHQANLRILNEFEKKVTNSCIIKGEGKRNVPHVIKMIQKMGNLSGATLPVALDYLVKEKFSNEIGKLVGKKFLFVSVGGGYTYSALLYQF